MKMPIITTRNLFAVCSRIFRLTAPALALFCGATSASGQQEQHYTQFMFNKLAYNAGYAGSYESPTLTAVYRNQWIGIEGAPNTQAISYHQPVLKNRVGFGGNIVRNSIGISRTITVDIAYAYRIELQRGVLGVGLQASMRHLQQNWSDPRIIRPQPSLPDDAIPVDPQSKLLPNFGAGIFYNGPKWYAGISVPRLVRNNIDLAVQKGELAREIQHFYAMGGVSLSLAESVEFTPQVLLKYVPGAPFDADVNASLMFKEKFYTGLTYRTGGDTNGAGESLDAMVGMQMTRNLFFCLSYDIGLTALRKASNGSVEATARWWFNVKEGEEIVDPNNPF